MPLTLIGRRCAQPSPVERILDKEEFTLDELLDEDDLIQEAKSLNGRLIALWVCMAIRMRPDRADLLSPMRLKPEGAALRRTARQVRAWVL